MTYQIQMTTFALRSALIGAALLCLPGFAAFALAQAAPDGAPADPALNPAGQPGDARALEALEQGPIHEAFAEPIDLNAEPEPAIQREPPPPIEELPPEVRPEGNNVQWVPGYWKWSDEIADFVWVTGLWRDVPPGREWIPGYWTEAEGGFVWVHGYWNQANQREERFLPIPPATLEIGPSSPAPAANYFWIPGCWIWRTNGYAWRTGYWYAGQPNWVWVPSHYALTPRGALYVHGYWDYPVVRRGLLFAPVRRATGFAIYAGFNWRPYRVVDTSLLLTSLFVHGRYGHYYYGYGGWRSPHIHPWYAVKRHHRHYDPLFAYHSWHDGQGRSNWTDKYERHFQRRGQFAQDHSQGGGDFRPGARPRFEAPSDKGDLVKDVKELPNSRVVSRRAIDSDRRDFDFQAKRARVAQSERRNLERATGGDARGVSGVATNGPTERGNGRGRGDVGAVSGVRDAVPPVRGEFGGATEARQGRSRTEGSADSERRQRFAADVNRGVSSRQSASARQLESTRARNDLIRRSGPALGNDGPSRRVVRDQSSNSSSSGESRRVEAARPIIRGNDAPQASRSRESFQAPSRAQWAEAVRQRAEASAPARADRSSSAAPSRGRIAPPSRGTFQTRESPSASQELRRSAPSRSAPSRSAPSRMAPSRTAPSRSVQRSGSGRPSFVPQQRGSLRSTTQDGSSRAISSGRRAQFQPSTSRGPAPAARSRGGGDSGTRGISRGGGRGRGGKK